MKRFIFTIVSLSLLGSFAQAGHSVPIEKEGEICIVGPDFTFDEVQMGISNDYTPKGCEPGQGIINLRKLDITHSRGGSCPFGNIFKYKVRGSCYII